MMNSDAIREEGISRSGPIQRLLSAFYPPEPSSMASFEDHERIRRGKLIVFLVLLLIIISLIILPATFFIPNKVAVFAICALLLLLASVLFINRAGHTIVSGILIICAVEAVIVAVILTTRPFDTFNLPLFDLLCIGILLAGSLLPSSFVFSVVGINILFMWVSLSYQIHTPAFQQILHTQLYNALARPAILQIALGGICVLWVRSAKYALKRADAAEGMARLQSAIAAHERNIALEKEKLEHKIEDILQTHTEALNGNMVASIPLPEGTPLLIPLVGALNSLWIRLYHSRKAEQELVQVHKELSWCLGVLQNVEPMPERVIQYISPRSAVAPLLRAIIMRERRFGVSSRP